MTTDTSKGFYSCPVFPNVTLEFTTKIQWSLIAAKKHVTLREPIIHVRFECPVQKVAHEKLPIRKCRMSEIRQSYVDSQRFRDSLRNVLFRLGGPIWLEFIERFVRSPLSVSETKRMRITAPDGTTYIKSKARIGSPLYSKWYKIPPGFKNISQAGNLATVVESPPEDLIKTKEYTYCLQP